MAGAAAVETSERLLFARELGAGADAELGVYVRVRWLATDRSARNKAAATSRFVRPSATRAATRRSAGVSPSLAGAPTDAARALHALLSAQLSALRAVSKPAKGRLDRLAGGSLLPGPSPDDARARAEHARGRTDRRPPRASRSRPGVVAIACSTLAWAAATRPRQRATWREHPGPADPSSVRLPGIQHATASAIRPSSSSAST